MKKLLVSAVLALVTLTASAQAPSFKKLSTMAVSYAALTGCSGGEVQPKMVTKFADPEHEIVDAYIVGVATDADCMGGSGTGTMNLIVLKRAEGRDAEMDPAFSYLRVAVKYSEPSAQAIGSPRNLTSIYQKNGQLFATGLEYGTDDSNCCPSLKTLYKIKLQKKVVALSKDDSRDIYTWEFTKVKNY